MQILLVGHRGVGKTRLGGLLADIMERPHIDLDRVIERETGLTCAELVARDEERFRELEQTALVDALAVDDAIITPGAGLGVIPTAPIVIWLTRDGWEHSALEERPRLRPELEWAEELEWMAATREPRWLSAAHLHVRIPRGRTPDRVAEMLAAMVKWLEAPWSGVAAKTWIVPAGPSELERAGRDAIRFDLAGVEVRSDTIIPFRAAGRASLLASMRSDDMDWIGAAAMRAQALDIDIAYLDTFERGGGFSLEPRPLILSTHPDQVDPEDVTALTTAARRIQLEHPAWAAGLSLKYAPAVEGFADVGMGRALLAPLRRANVSVTYIPQGDRWAWLRPILARDNADNYVAARLRGARLGLDGEEHAPWDLQDWLPHLVAPEPQTWDALIGDPVAQSQGDVWHRAASLRRGEAIGYLKVGVRKNEFDAALALLAEIGIRGVSVTSPLKSEVKFICPDDAAFGELLSRDALWLAIKDGAPVRSGNTLLRHDGRWLATDTDECGMEASLNWFESCEFGPATIALFGAGGVSDAVVRAIESSDWFIVHHARARTGWTDETPPFVTLVVNAAGSAGRAQDGAPRSRAWLDLHYADVQEPPEDAVHLAGDIFFDAQASAQRRFWAQE